MCTRAQFKFPFSSKGSKKKNPKAVSRKKMPGFRDLFGGEMRNRSKFEFAFVSTFFLALFCGFVQIAPKVFRGGLWGGGGEHLWRAKREPYRTGRGGHFWPIFDFTCKRRF